MPHVKLRPTFDLDQVKLNELQKVVPEAFADGKINWEALRAALGQHLEDEGENAEHFGLNWPGKRKARQIAFTPSTGTLIPAKGEGVDEASSQNIFIEGENLEVLKLLQKSYAGKVKMIYIDPPYNTGNDFIYPDNFAVPLETYLKLTGQKDSSDALLTTNVETSGRFHSAWLSMIYPRLYIARQLLRDDGLIFVSIDDTEVHNLRFLMNELFGEENFVEQIVWKNKYGSGALTRGFANVHEYILCYSRTKLVNVEAPLTEEAIKKYKNKDSKFDIRGGYITQPLATTSKDARPNLRYPIRYKGKDIWPKKQWVWSKERFEKAFANDEIVINERNGEFSVRTKQYLKDESGKIRNGKPVSIFNGPFNQDGTQEIAELFGAGVFDFPKPSRLIKYLCSFVINDSDERDGLYLDFFSGAGTLAHAILQLNAEDGGNRKFLLVQLPAPTPDDSSAREEGFKTIAEVGKERIRRVVKKIGKESPKKLKDAGFRVFKLAHSNFRFWQDYAGGDVKELEDLFNGHNDPLRENWKKRDLLTEILLHEGVLLTAPVQKEATVKKNDILIVEDNARRLVICLDEKLYAESLKAITLGKSDTLICLDSALTDEQKLRLSDKGLLKTI